MGVLQGALGQQQRAGKWPTTKAGVRAGRDAGGDPGRKGQLAGGAAQVRNAVLRFESLKLVAPLLLAVLR